MKKWKKKLIKLFGRKTGSEYTWYGYDEDGIGRGKHWNIYQLFGRKYKIGGW